jgi:hypothetical protein
MRIYREKTRTRRGGAPHTIQRSIKEYNKNNPIAIK